MISGGCCIGRFAANRAGAPAPQDVLGARTEWREGKEVLGPGLPDRFHSLFLLPRAATVVFLSAEGAEG
jgi:hypothetical protein